MVGWAVVGVVRFFHLQPAHVLKAGHLNIKQIRYFAAVVERGSLSAAAKSQHITVQAISKSVGDLEDGLGCELFVRTNQGMVPTPFAIALHDRATKVLARFDELQAFAQNHERRTDGLSRLRLALNTPAFLQNEVVRENTAALVQAQVGVETTMALAVGEQGMEGLRSGDIDVLVTVGVFTHPDVECRPVGTVPSAVLMSREHPLTAKTALSLSDIAPYPVARSTWFDAANDSIVSLYRARGAEVSFVDLDICNIGPFLSGGGIVFTTGIPALEKAHEMLAMRPFTPEDTVTVPICTVYLKARSQTVEATLQGLFSSGATLSSFGKAMG